MAGKNEGHSLKGVLLPHSEQQLSFSDPDTKTDWIQIIKRLKFPLINMLEFSVTFLIPRNVNIVEPDTTQVEG